MITGFNTDVEHEGVVYHVQTEDKGLKSPLILSLVYVGGTILASKRTPYDDLIASGFDEQTLVDRVGRQHKLICAAIHAGRIEDLKRQTVRDSAARAKPAEGELSVEQPETAQKIAPPERDEEPAASDAAEVTSGLETAEVTSVPATVAEAAPPETAEEASPPNESDIFELGSFADFMPPSSFVSAAPVENEAPATEVDATSTGQSDDHVDYSRVVDYSNAETSGNDLQITLFGEEEFIAGEFVKIQLRVGRGWDSCINVADASVTLKILGSSFRPLIFSGKTALDGTAVFYAMLPYFTSGRAAILVSATDGGEKAELRRVIHQP